MKKEYMEPEIGLIELEVTDVITTSYVPGEDELPLVPADF